jgi:hypothetical protein
MRLALGHKPEADGSRGGRSALYGICEECVQALHHKIYHELWRMARPHDELGWALTRQAAVITLGPTIRCLSEPGYTGGGFSPSV